jgi:hypothetical protein
MLSAQNVQKGRLRHLISNKVMVERIRDGAQRAHRAVEVAYAFNKLLYLEAYHKAAALAQQRGVLFDRQAATCLARAHPLKAEVFEDALDVVSSTLARRRGRAYGADTKLRMERLHAFYNAHAVAGNLPSVKVSGTNLSYVFEYEAKQMLTAHKNNVFRHYDRYVRRYAKALCARQVLLRHGVDSASELPLDVRRAFESNVAAVVDDVLEQRTVPSTMNASAEWRHLVSRLVNEVTPARPKRATGPGWRLYQQKAHPEQWLPFMVHMNAQFESLGVKGYKPFPMRTSFVTCHIRLDTQALLDLAVHGRAELCELKAALEAERSSDAADAPFYHLPGLSTRPTKNQFMVALTSLVAPEERDGVQGDKYASARYRTAIWSGVTKLGRRPALQTFNGKRFNNMIDTDGYSMSLHYVEPHLFGCTVFKGDADDLRDAKAVEKLLAEDSGIEYTVRLLDAHRQRLLASGAKLVGVDPGKGVLALATDGERIVRYTAAQRRVESSAARNADELRSKLKKQPRPGGAAALELANGALQALSYRRLQATLGSDADESRSASSCVMTTFCAYLKARWRVAPALRELYEATGMLRARFRAYCGRTSSEAKFVQRLRAAFGADAIMLYGDWGRAPNLSHQAPTIGVGLTRVVAHAFPSTFLVAERLTSSICPCCEVGGLTKPRTRHQSTISKPIHHLLRCQNEHSCPSGWWNRDVLGALNILKKARHALETGAWHPCFSRAVS